MRADRLLSILLLLQGRGKITAGQLAAELEVSERTIYRDIDALSMAGVPVYGEAGRDGGYTLLDSYRTSLTGLTDQEVRALFMLSIPAPIVALGVGGELRGALRKLSAALPTARRDDEQRVRQRFHLDATWWQQGEEPVPHLRTLYDAVWQDRRLRLRYRPLFAVEIEQVVDPLGLVAKAGIWYLVCARNEQTRVHRVSDLLDAQETEEQSLRPAGFDLASFWQEWCARYEGNQVAYCVQVRVSSDLIPHLPPYFGERIRHQLAQAGPPDEEGRVLLNLRFESLDEARSRLLAFGRAIEVLTPRELRRSMIDYAEQILELYS